MLYTCTSCRLILPNRLTMDLKKCPNCGRMPNLEFKTADSLLSQGYSQYTHTDPISRTPSKDPPHRQDPTPIPNIPVEAPPPTVPQGTPQPLTARSGNSRLDWMDHEEAPAPEPAPPQPPAPGPRNRQEPAPKPNVPRPGGHSTESRPVAPPTSRPRSSQPTPTGSSTIEGGPTGNTTSRFDRGSFNISFILQLLLLLAVIIVVGILIYSIWSMREQIVQTLTTVLVFIVIGAVAIFLLRRRF